MAEEKDIKLTEKIRINLALIATIVTFIFSYAKQTYEITNLQKSVEKLEQQKIETDRTVNSIANDIVYIRTTLDYLKQRI